MQGHRSGYYLPIALALLAAALIVLTSPYIGEIRAWMSAQLGPRFVSVMNVGVGAAALTVVAAAIARVRDHRARRYTLLVIAFGLAAVFGAGSEQLSATSRAVERFHFVEYGLLTLLFVRAWRPAGDWSAIVLPVFAGLLTGTADEGLQWFVPNRYGELRDVFLNLVAIACGLLATFALMPPGEWSWRLRPRSRVRVIALGAATAMTIGVFTWVVHVGAIVDDGAVRFRSRYTATALAALAAERRTRWPSAPPPSTMPPFSREDQYLTEGLWHVQARNTAWDANDVRAAWGENQILEVYFAPVLSLGHAWPAEQREDASRRVTGGGLHVSAAERA